MRRQVAVHDTEVTYLPPPLDEATAVLVHEVYAAEVVPERPRKRNWFELTLIVGGLWAGLTGVFVVTGVVISGQLTTFSAIWIAIGVMIIVAITLLAWSVEE